MGEAGPAAVITEAGADGGTEEVQGELQGQAGFGPGHPARPLFGESGAVDRGGGVGGQVAAAAQPWPHGRVQDVLTDGDSELKIVIMTAAPGSADETKLRLAVIAGPPAGASDSPRSPSHR